MLPIHSVTVLGRKSLEDSEESVVDLIALWKRHGETNHPVQLVEITTPLAWEAVQEPDDALGGSVFQVAPVLVCPTLILPSSVPRSGRSLLGAPRTCEAIFRPQIQGVPTTPFPSMMRWPLLSNQ